MTTTSGIFPAGTIVLNSENDTFWAGSLISGSLQFVLITPTTFNEISMLIEGEAQVKWSYKKNSDRSIYTGRENYMFCIINLAGGRNGPCTLGPGPVELPFQYQLPLNIPSSFEDDKAVIFYRVAAFTNYDYDGRPNLNKALIRDIKVVLPKDLNDFLPNREPIEIDYEEIGNGCFCCFGDVVNVKLRAPHRGYCPGQAVPVQVSVNNESAVEISRIKMDLLKRMEYRSQNPPSVFVTNDILARVKPGPVLSKSTKSYTIDVDVPADIPFNIDPCSIIKITYLLKVKIYLTGCNSSWMHEEELTFGTIPLRGFQDLNYMHPQAELMPRVAVPPQAQPTVYPTNTPYPTPNISYPLPNSSSPISQNELPYSTKVDTISGPNSPHIQYTPNAQGNIPYQQNVPYPVGNAPYATSGMPSPNPYTVAQSYPNVPYRDEMSNPPPYSPSFMQSVQKQ